MGIRKREATIEDIERQKRDFPTDSKAERRLLNHLRICVQLAEAGSPTEETPSNPSVMNMNRVLTDSIPSWRIGLANLGRISRLGHEKEFARLNRSKLSEAPSVGINSLLGCSRWFMELGEEPY